MTQEIYVENLNEVIRNKKLIEKKFNVKLKNKGKIIFIEGKAENEFKALSLMEAVNTGFSVDNSLKLTGENIIFQKINIKDITKRKDLERIRARIIGTRGKTIKTLSDLTNCSISLNDNQIGIIGDAEKIEEAIQSITSLIQGSKHGHIYNRLERQKRKNKNDDYDIDLDRLS